LPSPKLNIKPFDEDLHSFLNPKSSVASLLINYINKHPDYDKNKGMCCLIENGYIDRDYLIDYSIFYSRCFFDYGRKTDRIHFFNTSCSDLEKRIEKIHNSTKNLKEIDSLNTLYFGFIVKKPTPTGSIGRTVMRKYPFNSKNGDERHLNVSCTNVINLYGIPLRMISLPYQEQDHAVSACATISIWTALKALEEKFHTSIALAPSEITNFAFESSSFFDTPRFPNDGLNIYQMVNLFAKLGYEVITYELLKNVDDNEFIQDIIIGYLSFGLPIIATLEITDKDGKIDGHATVISGYRFDKKENKIKKLYVHDDQITAYSSVDFIRNNFLSWNNDWRQKKGCKKVILSRFLIPVYHKIRLPFTFIYTKFIKDYRKTFTKYGLIITPLLRDVNMYKEELINELMPKATYKEEIQNALIKQFPKYFWIIRISTIDGFPLSDTILDATQPIVEEPYFINFHKIENIK